jgi:hypothetical protein
MVESATPVLEQLARSILTELMGVADYYILEKRR